MIKLDASNITLKRFNDILTNKILETCKLFLAFKIGLLGMWGPL